MHVVIGTAGHIDHGKTALIKALTGTDADRLPEEKRRGITVDLGFAKMTAGDINFDFVDVPGHERFVKNMLAGASGIDLVMLVIAADEGVMPQTREHFDICRLLGMRAGIVVLTKTDLVDADDLELATLDAAELVAGSFLEGAPFIGVSSRTGTGVDLLNEQLVRTAGELQKRSDELVMRLPLDRSFTVKGFGSVVTGTLASGSIADGAELEILPTGTPVRVRGLQRHGKPAESASAGQRIAINLGGVDYSDVSRGMVLTEPGVLRPTQIIDSEIEVLPGAAKPLRSRQRIRFHIGTIEALARIQVLDPTGEIAPGAKGFAQIRLEVPVVAVPGERFIARSYSPQLTIAGGVVIDTSAVKHRRRDFASVTEQLSAMLAASVDKDQRVFLYLKAARAAGMTFQDLQARTALQKELLAAAIEANVTVRVIVAAGNRYLARDEFEHLCELAAAAIEDYHRREPVARGISREALSATAFAHLPAEVLQSVLAAMQASETIVVDRDIVRLTSHRAQLSPEGAAVSEAIVEIYVTAGLEVPKLDEALDQVISGTMLAREDARKYLQVRLDTGEIVRVTEEFYFAKGAIDALVARLRRYADGTSDRLIDVPKFKDLAGISRKYAIPLLEYFDRERVTVRAGDKRVIL